MMMFYGAAIRRSVMKRCHMAILTAIFWCAVPGTEQAAAQQASSFEQLQLLVKPGDTVVVTDMEGRSTKGKIEGLSRESLRLKSSGNIREFGQRDAIEIKQRRSDSLANGALIGAAVGGGIGALGAIAFCKEGWCRGNGAEVAATIGVHAGMGTAIGVGIDALVRSRQTIYRSSPQTAFSRVHVAPLIGSGRRGVALKWSF
jgi:hypothetical protein